MADQYSNEGSSSSNISQECLDSTVQLNIKTLDSRIFSFQVNKNMPVLFFKEKIANDIGVPVGQQRLIFRGKVLKDDHPLSEYHVENGHTLHLVERQPTQSQLPSNVSPGETSTNTVNRGNDSTEGAPRNLIGQVSHSVVLGTFNVGEQSEGIVPDLSRVVGAVLNSIGIGSQAATNSSGGPQFVLPNYYGQASQGNEGGTNVNLRNLNQGGNQTQPGQTVPNRPLTSFPQLVQIPVAAAAVPIPSLDVPIPDSLNTLSVFMNRLENVLSRNGNQLNSSSNNVGDLPRVELPSNAQGLRTAEVLSAVLRHAQRLLSDHAVSSLSHIAGRLEREGASLDANTRSQIQTESMQLGLAMQQLGALFLELGRAILTLRMGQSPEESVVNAGPAVYISPSGPNPIMVQPFPLQTSSLFGASIPPSNPFNLGPVGVGNVPRHINIHIHGVGTRPNNADGLLGERQNETGSLDSGAPRELPVRNVISSAAPPQPNIITAAIPLHPNIITAVPPRPTGITVSTPTQPDQGVSISLPLSESVISSSVVTDSGTSFMVDTQEDSMVRLVRDLPSITSNNNEADMLTSEDGRKKSHIESNETIVLQDSSTSSTGRTAGKSEDIMENIDQSGKPSVAEGVQAVPLGLGLGGLGRRKPGRQLNMQDKRSVMGATSSGLSDQSKKPTAVSTGQQILQSLASGKATDRSNASNSSAARSPSTVSSGTDGRPLQGDDSNGQIDLTSAMSRALQNPALSGFLTGVSDQLGAGSPDVLRNMLQQVTQSPQMRNTVNEIARQIDTQEVERMFTGMGRDQSGSLDFQKIFQQMMPVVSRVFNRGSTETFPSMETDLQPNHDRSLNSDKLGRNSQVDVQPVVQRIERQSPPGDIFQAVVESSVQFADDNNSLEDMVGELCTDDELINDYLDILRQDLSKLLEGDGNKKS